MPRSGVAGLCGKCMFSFLKTDQADFQSGGTAFSSHEGVGGPGAASEAHGLIPRAFCLLGEKPQDFPSSRSLSILCSSLFYLDL